MPTQIIELGLCSRRKSDGETFVARMGKLVGRLFALLSEIAVESESLKTAAFRAQLERWQSQLENIVDGHDIESILEECLARCHDYFRHAQGYLDERETEIREVLEVLRDAVASLRGQNDSFNRQLLDSSTRFKRMNEIEDIRELKKQIRHEVAELARLVAEKKQQEETFHAKMQRRFDLLQDRLKQTKQEVLLDPLTKVGNRRSVDMEIKRALQNGGAKSLVLALLDLDDFKNINDLHGHQAGDQALVRVAVWLGSQIRSGDYLGRYGGDEFVILFRDTTLPQAEIRFLQLLAAVAGSPVKYTEAGETRSIRLTLSCGLAESIPGDEPEDLLRRADKALYQAKQRGKNCLSTWGAS